MADRRPFDAPFELRVRWKRTIGAGYSGIVVSNGTAITMASDGSRTLLVALASDTGEEKWRAPLGPAFPGRDGSAGGPVSTPALDEGVVFALAPWGELAAVRMADGSRIWTRHLVDDFGASVPHWGFTTSPLVVGDVVVVLTGGSAGAVTALDKRTGSVRWRTGSDTVSYQSPMLATVSGRERIIGAGDRLLFAIDPADGREIWQYEHGGRGFYGQIVNPVAVGGGLLITYRPDESVLLNVDREPSVAWTTRELKSNYGTPVVHGGSVFGYSGAFLSCIDATTGALRWRSRPPGDGFPIVVGDRLVVLTKAGSVLVARADPQAFAPEATLEVFSRLVWTPPSFADGRIFARDSYAEIAAVDIVPKGTTTSAPPPSRADAPSGTRFARWVAETERAPDRSARVEALLKEHAGGPIVEDERFVHFVHAGPAADVAVRGDMLELGATVPMRRLAGTDLQYASIELAPDARVAYQFVRDLETIADPRNPRLANSLNLVGPASLLLMPRGAMPPTPADAKPSRGRVVDLTLDSPEVKAAHLRWGGSRKVHVYLPPEYDVKADERYPVVYVLYGEEMLGDGRFAAAIDSAVGTTLRPAIAVFVESTSPYEYARTFREPHRRMLVDQLVPLVDGRFRTRAEPAQRVLLGADEAGFAAVETALLFPHVFGVAAAQSIYPLSSGNAELFALIDRSKDRRQRFHVDWGRYDPRRAADVLDVPGFTREVRDRLEAKGHTVTGREWPDGSDVRIWSERALRALQALLPLERR